MTNPIRTGEFIIFVKTTDEKGKAVTRYYATDSASGGYGYFSTSRNAAKVFKSEQDALDRLKENDFQKVQTMSDGTSFPPTMIHGALGLCNNLTYNHGIVYIAEILIDVVYSCLIESNLHPVPKDIKAAALAKLTQEEKDALGL